jgi:hypothetical protein
MFFVASTQRFDSIYDRDGFTLAFTALGTRSNGSPYFNAGSGLVSSSGVTAQAGLRVLESSHNARTKAEAASRGASIRSGVSGREFSVATNPGGQ